MGIFAAIMTAIFSYRIEIDHHDGQGWHQIHGLEWETTDLYGDAMAYAIRVRDDHPESEVRIIESAEGYPDHHILLT